MCSLFGIPPIQFNEYFAHYCSLSYLSVVNVHLSSVNLISHYHSSKPQDKTISATSTTDKTTEKGGKASLDSNSNIDQEAVFQKGSVHLFV